MDYIGGKKLRKEFLSDAYPSKISTIEQIRHDLKTALCSIGHSIANFAAENFTDASITVSESTPIYLLGERFPSDELKTNLKNEQEKRVIEKKKPPVILDEIQKKFHKKWIDIPRMCYRKNFQEPIIRQVYQKKNNQKFCVKISSDIGWGCSIRVAQTLLYIILEKLYCEYEKKDFCCNMNQLKDKITNDKKKKLISLFFDVNENVYHPFSIFEFIKVSSFGAKNECYDVDNFMNELLPSKFVGDLNYNDPFEEKFYDERIYEMEDRENKCDLCGIYFEKDNMKLMNVSSLKETANKNQNEYYEIFDDEEIDILNICSYCKYKYQKLNASNFYEMKHIYTTPIGISPGDWLGPASVVRTLTRLIAKDIATSMDLVSVVNFEGVFDAKKIWLEMISLPYKELNFIQKKFENKNEKIHENSPSLIQSKKFTSKKSKNINVSDKNDSFLDDFLIYENNSKFNTVNDNKFEENFENFEKKDKKNEKNDENFVVYKIDPNTNPIRKFDESKNDDFNIVNTESFLSFNTDAFEHEEKQKNTWKWNCIDCNCECLKCRGIIPVCKTCKGFAGEFAHLSSPITDTKVLFGGNKRDIKNSYISSNCTCHWTIFDEIKNKILKGDHEEENEKNLDNIEIRNPLFSRACLILLPIHLGANNNTIPIQQIPFLMSILEIKYFTGIIGGVRNQACLVLGKRGTELLVKDPHRAVHNAANGRNTDIETFYESCPVSVNANKLRPSMCISFLVKSVYDLIDLTTELNSIISNHQTYFIDLQNGSLEFVNDLKKKLYEKNMDEKSNNEYCIVENDDYFLKKKKKKIIQKNRNIKQTDSVFDSENSSIFEILNLEEKNKLGKNKRINSINEKASSIEFISSSISSPLLRSQCSQLCSQIYTDTFSDSSFYLKNNTSKISDNEEVDFNFYKV